MVEDIIAGFVFYTLALYLTLCAVVWGMKRVNKFLRDTKEER